LTVQEFSKKHQKRAAYCHPLLRIVIFDGLFAQSKAMLFERQAWHSRARVPGTGGYPLNSGKSNLKGETV
jgi:hypothetical protein